MGSKFKINIFGFVLAFVNISFALLDFLMRHNGINWKNNPRYPFEYIKYLDCELSYVPPMISFMVSICAIAVPKFTAGTPKKEIILFILSIYLFTNISHIASRQLFWFPSFCLKNCLLFTFTSIIYYVDNAEGFYRIHLKPWSVSEENVEDVEEVNIIAYTQNYTAQSDSLPYLPKHSLVVASPKPNSPQLNTPTLSKII